jgi:hypothetical protein
MKDHRSTADSMKRLRSCRVHTGPLAGCKNHGGERTFGHGV